MSRPPRWPNLLTLVAGLAVSLALVWRVAESVRGGEVLRFGRPWAFSLAGGVLLVAWFGFYKPLGRRASLWFSRAEDVAALPRGRVARLARLPTILRVIALSLIVVALARPQTFTEESRTVRGIDIMFVLDVSQSMEEQDMQRNRLDAGQRTIRNFLRKRQGRGDRVGLVVFAEEAMLHCPLTLDYRSMESIVAELEIGEVPALGTAIGDALGLALASLRRSDSKSKVVILLSDGDWNKAKYMDPGEARDLGVEMGVRVFTVLLGNDEAGLSRGERVQYGVNPTMLKDIAGDTGGLFFRAGDDRQLAVSFEEIRKNLPQSDAEVIGRVPHLHLFDLLLWPALGLLLLEVLLRMTRFRSFP